MSLNLFHLGSLKTKAYTTNGARIVYRCKRDWHEIDASTGHRCLPSHTLT